MPFSPHHRAPIPFANIKQYDYEMGRGQVTYIQQGFSIACRHFVNMPFSREKDLIWFRGPHSGREISGAVGMPGLGTSLSLVWRDGHFLKHLTVTVARIYSMVTFAVFHPTLKKQVGLSGAFLWNGTSVAGIVTGREPDDCNILWAALLPERSPENIYGTGNE